MAFPFSNVSRHPSGSGQSIRIGMPLTKGWGAWRDIWRLMGNFWDIRKVLEEFLEKTLVISG